MKKQVMFSILMSAWLSANADYVDFGRDYRPLRYLPLPAMAFTNASLTTVAQALEREFNAIGQTTHAGMINFLVHPSCTNLLVTFDTHESPIDLTLLLLKEMYDINHSTVHDNIILTRQPGVRMVSRIYNARPHIFPSEPNDGYDVAPYFSRLGVAFPEGASACYLPEHGRLVVHNRPDNLEALEEILAVLNVEPRQIETSLRVFRLDDRVLAGRTIRDLGTTNVQEVVKSSSTLFHLTSIASSGKTVTHALSAAVAASQPEQAPAGSAAVVMTPSVVAGREPGEDRIFLPLEISLAFPSGEDTRIEYALKTSLTLSNGADIILWLSPPVEEEENAPVIGLVLSARQVDPAGQSIPTPSSDLME